MKATFIANNNITITGCRIINEFLDLIYVIFVLNIFSVATVIQPRIMESGFQSNKTYLNAVNWIRENVKLYTSLEAEQVTKIRTNATEN